MSAYTRGPRTATPPAPRTNKYGGKCTLCNQWVHASAGVAIKPADRWVVQHNAGACPAPKPAAAKAPVEQPALGYYVRKDGAAIKVVASKRNPERHYGLVFTPHAGKRPTWEYVKGAGYSVADLTPMTATDAAQLGLSHGHCIQCCKPLGGASLSAAVSALIGYGEKCAANEGWPYPKGAAAQRAYIAEHGA